MLKDTKKILKLSHLKILIIQKKLLKNLRKRVLYLQWLQCWRLLEQ